MSRALLHVGDGFECTPSTLHIQLAFPSGFLRGKGRALL